MKTETKPPAKKRKRIETESMATRVALHPFLVGMNHTQLTLLTDCAIAAHFKPGQIILREGEMANRFYLIESGKVALESGENFGEPVIVETIGAGDLLGWSWMFPPYVWHFTDHASSFAGRPQKVACCARAHRGASASGAGITCTRRLIRS